MIDISTEIELMISNLCIKSKKENNTFGVKKADGLYLITAGNMKILAGEDWYKDFMKEMKFLADDALLNWRCIEFHKKTLEAKSEEKSRRKT